MTRLRRWVLMGLLATLMSSPADARQGAAADPPGVTRGAAQPNQNKWNAKGPWGKTERSAPMEAQRKAPFKLFDNVYYVGLQTVSAYRENFWNLIRWGISESVPRRRFLSSSYISKLPSNHST